MFNLDDYGTAGKYLKAKGWRIETSENLRGTAAADGPNKTIWILPKVYAKPGVRIKRYVMLHEVWHGVHYEVNKYDCDLLMAKRNLNKKSAIEVVADAACVILDKSWSMRQWVKASVIWHGRVGYRYSLKDVNSVDAYVTVGTLRVALQAWERETQANG